MTVFEPAYARSCHGRPVSGADTSPDDDEAVRHLLLNLFHEVVRSVSAESCMPTSFDRAAEGRTLIIAVGKAAAAMAATAATRIGGDCHGLVVTRAGHAGPPHLLPASFELLEAGHPVPDTISIAAAERAMALATALGRKDRLLMLVSGGGSALMSMPAPGVTLHDKQVVTQSLLRSGATVAEINCVRTHLSRIKGGRLAVAAAPAQVTTLLISDVPGDDPSFVASGPTVANQTTLADAREIVERYRINCPISIETALADSSNATPSANARGLAGGAVVTLARARNALTAGSACVAQYGYKVTDLGDHLQAEARHLGASHATLARQFAASGEPRVIISGGETTVTVVNRGGRGGRNLEYLLGLAIALDGAPHISAIACDTDGIDGTEDAAGAIITPDTLIRARALGLSAVEHLSANDAYTFFKALGDLVVTGPTRTNVNDFRAILIEASSFAGVSGRRAPDPSL